MNESAKKKPAGAKKSYLFELKATGASSPLPSCTLQYNPLAAVSIHLASLVLCCKLCWWQNRFPSLLVATNGVTIAVLDEPVQNKMKVSLLHRVQDFRAGCQDFAGFRGPTKNPLGQIFANFCFRTQIDLVTLWLWLMKIATQYLVIKFVTKGQVATPKLKPDIWQVTFDIWHLTSDFWHLAFDIWLLTSDFWNLTLAIWLLTFDTWHDTLKLYSNNPNLFLLMDLRLGYQSKKIGRLVCQWTI